MVAEEALLVSKQATQKAKVAADESFEKPMANVVERHGR